MATTAKTAKKQRARKAPKSPSVPVEELPEPGRREVAAIDEATERVSARRPRLAAKFGKNEHGGVKVGNNHSDGLGWSNRMMDAFGTRSRAFAETEMLRLLKGLASSNSTAPTQDTFNAALAVIDGIRPENEVEAMLASQMAMTHVLTMQAMSRAHWAEHIPEYQAAGSFAIKLSRTFTMQMEALAKLRRGGEQTVRVEHVHVHNGGQAIVGAVNHPGGGGVAFKNQNQPHATGDAGALVLAAGAPVLCQDPKREAVPVTSGEGQGPL
jgi:hypothetical protein